MVKNTLNTTQLILSNSQSQTVVMYLQHQELISSWFKSIKHSMPMKDNSSCREQLKRYTLLDSFSQLHKLNTLSQTLNLTLLPIKIQPELIFLPLESTRKTSLISKKLVISQMFQTLKSLVMMMLKTNRNSVSLDTQRLISKIPLRYHFST